MTDIHVIDHRNKIFYTKVLEQYHRIRHDIFVGERRWTALSRPDGLDIDSYDNQHAVYLIALDGERVVGGQRLYPTLRPHMLSEVFKNLLDRELPVSKTTLEWTRYFVIKEHRRTATDCKLLAAVQRYCLEEGITDLTAVGEMWWLPRWHQYGFIVHPLGLPRLIDDQPALAVRIEISEESYSNILQVGGLKPSELIRHRIETDDYIGLSDAA